MKFSSKRASKIITGLMALLPMVIQMPSANATQDPEFASQSQLFTMNVPPAWSCTAGRNYKIAIIDHSAVAMVSELQGKVTGANVANAAITNTDRATEMATTIAAIANNHTGTAGVAYDTRIISIHGDLSNRLSRAQVILDGLQIAMSQGCKIVVLNLPEVDDARNGFFHEYFNLTDFNRVNEAMRNFHDQHGGLIFMGSGNRNRDDRQTGELPYLIVVSNVDSNKDRAPNSNIGSHVWFGAPGHYVRVSNGQGAVVWGFGTGLAAANCAAVAALIWSSNFLLTNVEVERIMKATAQRPAGQTGRVNNSIGYGVPDAGAAVAQACLTLNGRRPILLPPLEIPRRSGLK